VPPARRGMDRGGDSLEVDRETRGGFRIEFFLLEKFHST
jgi:hypothetical protein